MQNRPDRSANELNEIAAGQAGLISSLLNNTIRGSIEIATRSDADKKHFGDFDSTESCLNGEVF